MGAAGGGGGGPRNLASLTCMSLAGRLLRAPDSAPVPKLVKTAKLKVYPSGTRNLGDTGKDMLNADLLALLKS